MSAVGTSGKKGFRKLVKIAFVVPRLQNKTDFTEILYVCRQSQGKYFKTLKFRKYSRLAAVGTFLSTYKNWQLSQVWQHLAWRWFGKLYIYRESLKSIVCKNI